MAGGSNDFVLDPLPLDDWRTTYLAFLQTVSPGDQA